MQRLRFHSELLGLSGSLALLVASSFAFAQAPDSARPSASPANVVAPGRRGWAVDEQTGCRIWIDNQRLGETVTWTGQCDSAGRASGRGTLERRYDGRVERFEGVLHDCKANGQGVLTLANGNRYAGQFRDGAPNGHGVATFTNGDRQEGEFRDWVLNGYGVVTHSNGDTYAGEYRDGKLNGHGVGTSTDGARYEGEYRDDRANGRGVFTSADGLRYSGWFHDGEEGPGFTFDTSAYTGWIVTWTPDVYGWNVGFLLVGFTFAGLLTAGVFFGIRWLVFLPGDRACLNPTQRRRIAILAALGSSFGFMLVAAVLYFLSLPVSESLFELFAIALVALGLVAFLDPLFERLQRALGIAAGHPPTARQSTGAMMRRVSFAILLLNGVLHTLLHEFVKTYPGLSTALVAGYGPISTLITTYCWLLGWHPDPSRSRAALRGAVSGMVAGLIVMWGWVPYLEGIGKLVVPLFGVLVMTLVPLAGGLAMDRRWGWGLGWESRASLSMTLAMLVAWSVAGSLYWLWVLGFEKNLWHAFATELLPIPAPSLIMPSERPELHRAFLLLSGPVGVAGWGLGLFLSGRFDTLLMEQRLQTRSPELPGFSRN